MKTGVLEYKVGFTGSFGPFLRHVFFGASFYVFLVYLAPSPDEPSPPLWIQAWFMVPVFLVCLGYFVFGIFRHTKRVILQFKGDKVEITEAMLLGNRRTWVSPDDRPEILLNRPVGTGLVKWSITITEPKRFQFGKGLSGDDLIEIKKALHEALM